MLVANNLRDPTCPAPMTSHFPLWASLLSQIGLVGLVIPNVPNGTHEDLLGEFVVEPHVGVLHGFNLEDLAKDVAVAVFLPSKVLFSFSMQLALFF